MTIESQLKILNSKKYYEYLKDNSNWIKQLNRSDNNFLNYQEFIKDKYSLRFSDKVNDFVDNIDTIQKILGVLK